ncbi:MAG: Ig-like domain-containing protein, partial [Burkholderiales bacterium]
PSIVGVNLPGTTEPETSQIVAVVRVASDNPVKGRTVTFQVVAGTGGLSSPQAVTDSSGQASVVYTPGPSPSGASGVQVLATVLGTGISQTVPLTVNERELTVSVGTGNETIKIDEVFNETPYGVLVTDSAGSPVSGVTVSPSVVALTYAKGFWVRNEDESRWDQVVTAVCPSEDTNGNLLLDAGEDFNANGQLDPRNSDALVKFEGDSLTDDSGSVSLRVRYLRDRSAWVRVRLRVTATVVAGTEGAAQAVFYLPILASEVTNLNESPPGVVSPYGVSESCADPN